VEVFIPRRSIDGGDKLQALKKVTNSNAFIVAFNQHSHSRTEYR